MNERYCTVVLVICFAILCPAFSLFADGVIVPYNVMPEPTLLGEFYSVKYHRVWVDIEEQMATTTVEQAFVNETGRPIEVQYIFPLPHSAQVNKFTLIVGDKEIEGRILAKDEARRIYEEIVRSQRDPALLEYIEYGMIRTNVFPLPPHGEQKVKLVYSELLTKDGNRIEYRYPLNTEKFSRELLQQVSIDVELESSSPMKTVYSPSHNISPQWNSDRRVTGRWSDENIRPDNDFRLFWALSEEEVGATMFAYRPDKSEDGFFLLLASPRAEIDKTKVIKKNVILVLDISGSMSGEKIEQARGAARFVAENINPGDRFNVVFYNDIVDPLWDELQEYDSDTRVEALSHIGGVEAGGSTDIHAALTTALGQIKDKSRPNFIIFLTDGLPTSGITELDKIVEGVREANKHNTRLFCFGVGYDVNAVLLDRLGAENHGLAEYVPPGEDIEGKVSRFYAKIQNPALTNITIDYGDVRVRDVYPRTTPDLFKGGQLVIVGRYRDFGKEDIVISGVAGDKKQSFEYSLDFAEKTDIEEFSFVARLWAQKKIGWLIEQIRLHGEEKELVEEIVRLSTRYGIMTQYTSFLADEEVEVANIDANVIIAHEAIADRAFEVTGAAGVSQSIASGKLQQDAQAPAKAAYIAESGEEMSVDVIKIIGSKTFYLKKEVWIDAEYNEDMELTEVEQFADDYFTLANSEPTQAQYITFAPQKDIIVVIGGQAYKIIAPK